ncbi:MAG TPA: hypothetical protein PK493_21770, partial [Pseudomonadota bacterium]|nr:hypothetical protein [Pseudomonadota bacterium]
IGEHDGEKFLTMELLSGQSLSQRLIDTVDGKPRPLPLREIATLLDQLCAALTAAHRSGIIHCDTYVISIVCFHVGHFGPQRRRNKPCTLTVPAAASLARTSLW